MFKIHTQFCIQGWSWKSEGHDLAVKKAILYVM